MSARYNSYHDYRQIPEEKRQFSSFDNGKLYENHYQSSSSSIINNINTTTSDNCCSNPINQHQYDIYNNLYAQQYEEFLKSMYMQPIPEESHSHSQTQSHVSRSETPRSPTQNRKSQKLQNDTSKYSNNHLLIMTIDIGNGNFDTINVFDNDNPLELAKNFGKKHELNQNIVDLLAQNIYKNMEQAIKDRQNQMKDSYSKETICANACQDTQSSSDYTTNTTTKTYISQNHSATDIKSSSLEHQKNHRKNLTNSNIIMPDDYNKCDTSIKSTSIKRNKRDRWLNLSYDNRCNKSLTSSFIKVKSPTMMNTNNIDMKSQLQDYKTKRRRHNTDLPNMEKKGLLIPYDNINYSTKEIKYIDDIINEASSQLSKDYEKNELTFTPKINKDSKNIINNSKINSKTPVYERLHNIAVKKLKKKIKEENKLSQSQHSSNNKSTLDFDTLTNYGSLLYHKGLKKQEELLKTLSEKKKELLEQEEKECTFKPAVNAISNEIVLNKNRCEPPEEILIKFGKEVKEKFEKQRSIKTMQEIESCSFKPEINRISEKIATGKDKGTTVNRYLKLFNDHKDKLLQQEQKQKLYDQELKFTPMVNTYSSKLVDQTTFEERNRKYIEKVEKFESLKKQKENESLYDLTTGKPLFRPKTGRAPNHRNRENIPIGDYLYNQRVEIQNTKRNFIEKVQKTITDSMIRLNDKSQILVQNNKIKRLQAIFQILDSDGDGMISSAQIDISAIETGILELIAPILYEMEDRNQTLTESDFIEEADKLLKTLSIQEKFELLMGKRDNSSKVDEECTFKPQINKKSKQLAEGRRPQGVIGLYEQSIEERKVFEEKLKQERENRLQEELRECSFRPFVNISNSIMSFKFPESDFNSVTKTLN